MGFISGFAGAMRNRKGGLRVASRAHTRSLAVAAAMLVSLCTTGGPADAATYGGTGTVAAVRSHDAAVSDDWFELTGVTSLGSCPLYNGLVLIVLKDDDRGWRHFAMVLSAKRAGTAISAWVDDTKLTASGYCYVQYMQQ